MTENTAAGFLLSKSGSAGRNKSRAYAAAQLRRIPPKMSPSFPLRIAAMNAMYRLPSSDTPIVPADAADRLEKFKKTLLDEIDEVDDIVAMARRGDSPLDIAVAIADLLGDIVVYCRSEALKYGLPLEQVLDVIMDSNESKLGANGEPIYDANGKFLKGPFYWKPEPRIRELLAGSVRSSEA